MTIVVSSEESPRPSFFVTFTCKTRTCLEKVLKALGYDIKEIEEKLGERIGLPTRLVFTDVTPFLCENTCDASLVSLSEHVYRLIGNVEEIDTKQEWEYCGPDSYTVPCTKYKLAKGAIIYHQKRGYTGDTSHDSDTLYINPAKKVRVEGDKLVIEEAGGQV